jgi:hypothetical protein
LLAEGSQTYLLLNTPAKSHWIIERWFDIEENPEAPGFTSPRPFPASEESAST